jgi:hypothetical protein
VRDDAVIPQAAGREMASGTANAHFVSVPKRNHVPLPGEPTADRAFEEIERFLAKDLPSGAA